MIIPVQSNILYFSFYLLFTIMYCVFQQVNGCFAYHSLFFGDLIYFSIYWNKWSDQRYKLDYEPDINIELAWM